MQDHHQWTMPHPSTQDIDYDADTEVVKPYAIEEPDDERLETSEPDRFVASSLPDNLERWHIDLIDSMDDLQCESDRTDSTQRSDQKRGQKRKSGAAASGASPSAHQSSASAPSGTKHGDRQYETPSMGRKRSRKRSKRVKEDQNRANDSSPTTSNGSEACMSSSSAARSTDASGTETGTMNSDSTADKMDVD
jgi:hypothetical protein